MCVYPAEKRKNYFENTNPIGKELVPVDGRPVTAQASLLTDALKKEYRANPTKKAFMGVNPCAKFTLESY